MNKISKSKSAIFSFYVILTGNLIVNLPVTLVILSLFLIIYNLDLGWITGVMIGSFAGWLVWAELLKLWKKWAFKRGVSPERLYYLGKGRSYILLQASHH